MNYFKKEKIKNLFQKFPLNMTVWIGTTASLIIHTILFILTFVLIGLGFDTDKVLLVLTTIVSLEAIYLSIFIQMTVNTTAHSLGEVEENIEAIHENVEELEDSVQEISEDIEEIQVDQEEAGEDLETKITLEKIESGLQKLLSDIEVLKSQK